MLQRTWRGVVARWGGTEGLCPLLEPLGNWSHEELVNSSKKDCLLNVRHHCFEQLSSVFRKCSIVLDVLVVLVLALLDDRVFDDVLGHNRVKDPAINLKINRNSNIPLGAFRNFRRSRVVRPNRDAEFWSASTACTTSAIEIVLPCWCGFVGEKPAKVVPAPFGFGFALGAVLMLASPDDGVSPPRLILPGSKVAGVLLLLLPLAVGMLLLLLLLLLLPLAVGMLLLLLLLPLTVGMLLLLLLLPLVVGMD